MQSCKYHGTAAITPNGRCATCDAENLAYAKSAEFRKRAPRKGVR